MNKYPQELLDEYHQLCRKRRGNQCSDADIQRLDQIKTEINEIDSKDPIAQAGLKILDDVIDELRSAIDKLNRSAATNKENSEIDY